MEFRRVLFRSAAFEQVELDRVADQPVERRMRGKPQAQPHRGVGALPFGGLARKTAKTMLAGRQEERRRSQRSEEHTSELQSLMRISYAVFCLKKKHTRQTQQIKQENLV